MVCESWAGIDRQSRRTGTHGYPVQGEPLCPYPEARARVPEIIETLAGLDADIRCAKALTARTHTPTRLLLLIGEALQMREGGSSPRRSVNRAWSEAWERGASRTGRLWPSRRHGCRSWNLSRVRGGSRTPCDERKRRGGSRFARPRKSRAGRGARVVRREHPRPFGWEGPPEQQSRGRLCRKEWFPRVRERSAGLGSSSLGLRRSRRRSGHRAWRWHSFFA